MRISDWSSDVCSSDLCLDQNGKELPHAPRSILKRQLARARDMGYTVKIGTELEFYAFDESFDSVQQKRYRDLKTAGWYIEDYLIFQTTKEIGRASCRDRVCQYV